MADHRVEFLDMEADAAIAREEEDRPVGKGARGADRETLAHAQRAEIARNVERPRAFVRAENYFGPDRRRNVNPNYAGPERRKGGKAEVTKQQPLLEKARALV